ncbi:MAG: hypothetical protein M3350_06040 [Actinomycetota bacterium]|nr:hypothetical protein [Actinomycetota bacterium]
MATMVKVKKKCCKDDPRCKRCPVVLKRLDRAGHAERLTKRSYRFEEEVPKKALKAARAR